jgi:membrane protein involved in colicin uptake
MAQITGGKVSFKRSFQPEQYGSRGAEAELSFVVAEGEDLLKANEWFDRCGKLAQAKVMELVYAKAPAGSKAVTADLPAPAEKATAEVEALGALVVEADRKEGKEQAAAKLNAKDVAAKAKAAKGLEAIKAKEAAAKAPAEDPFAAEKPAAISTGEERIAPSDDSLEELMGGSPSPAVALTPKDCKDAVIKKMAAINNPKAIKVVIGKYVSLPQTITDIPVDKRAAFVAEIAALT